MSDTICAICTSLGVGAISIIRVSGDESFNIVSKLFSRDLNKLRDHSINYGYIKEEDEIIDEVLLSVMKAPNTYTKEDVVEINSHGGIATTNKILELLLENGCRLAEPGEFTKRAFLNGRIDISQAQAVNDLLYSKTNEARKVFMGGLTGLLNKKIESIRKIILDLISNLEVNIDFPEYEDNLVITNELLKEKISYLIDEFSKLLADANTTKILKDGLNVSLVGRPNAGKSSVLNALLNEDKAIVSDIKGTTRDVVEGTIELDGILVNFLDTAGIRNTNNPIEKIGVEKSYKLIQDADLVVLVLDSSQKISKEDQDIIKNTPSNKLIIFANKSDLKSQISLDKVIYGNTLNIEGIRPLKEAIINKFKLGEIHTKDVTYLTNANQISNIKKCLKIANNALKNTNENTFVDMIEIDLKEILDLLGEITGSSYDEELLDTLFKNFCLGK